MNWNEMMNSHLMYIIVFFNILLEIDLVINKEKIKVFDVESLLVCKFIVESEEAVEFDKSLFK
jgi:hypothetical protein